MVANIYTKPAFDWWVPHNLKKSNHIIMKVKSKYWLKTHKFGIKVPNNIKQSILHNNEKGNMLWWDAMCQDMKNVCPEFDTWEKTEGNIPSGYQEIKFHLTFVV